MELISILNIVTFFILAIYSIKAMNRISKGNESLGNFTILFIVFFNGLPLLLDVLIGIPKYGSNYIGFNLAINHVPSSIIYNIYILVVIMLLNRYSNKHSINEQEEKNITVSSSKKSRRALEEIILNFIVFTIVLLPLLHVIMSPYLGQFLVYGTASMRGISDSNFNEINAILRMTSLAVISIWILEKKKQGGFIEKLVFIFYSFILVWIDGKRYIIAFIIVIAFYTLWSRGRISGKKFLPFVVVMMLLLLGISAFYQVNMRSNFIDYSQFDNLYRSYRIDFSRDVVVKFAIYTETTPFPKILNYRGQSFLALLLMYVPRTIWKNKPYQYTKYITSSILQIPPESVSWGITFSIFDQSIANFGLLLGMPFSVFYLYQLIRLGDNSKNRSTKLLILLIIISSLTMNLAYIAPIILVSIGKMLYDKYFLHFDKNN